MKHVLIAVGLLSFGLVACNNSTPSAPTNPTFKASLSAAHEVPAPTVPADYKGRGSATVNWDGSTATLTGDYSGLTGAADKAHIHEKEVGQTGPAICTLTITEKTPAGTGTIASPAEGCKLSEEKLRAGLYYVNIHTIKNPAGEIRGQLFR